MDLFALSFPFKIQGCWYRIAFIKKTVDCRLSTYNRPTESAVFFASDQNYTFKNANKTLEEKVILNSYFHLITISFSFNIVCFN